MEKRITGNVLSDGLCIGNIVKWTDDSALPCSGMKGTENGSQIPEPDFAEHKKSVLNEDAECERFCKVKTAVDSKLNELLSCAENNTIAAGDAASEEAEIMRSYIAILNDPELEKDIVQRIREQKVFLNEALTLTAQEYADDMSALEDEYLKQRAQDFEQLFAMLLSYSSGSVQKKVFIEKPCILAAKALSPIDMSEVNKKFLLGIITEEGSKTSHAAIIARSYAIPMIAGIPYAAIVKNDTAVIDTEKKLCVLNPENTTASFYTEKNAQLQKEKEYFNALVEKRAVTEDGVHIELMANIGSVQEAAQAYVQNADGIGLFRTEFLLSEAGIDFPSEENQFETYRAVLRQMNGKSVTIRTFDIGGDKVYPCVHLPEEENPFLGWRGVRYMLDNTELLHTQLRALLRASVYGTLHIMFPMITTEEEVKSLLSSVERIKKDLHKEKIPYGRNVKVGVMIETPAAALIADKLAQIVDFFSIGTNDLTQYTLASDRNNAKIAHLYRENHPAVLQLIRMTIDAGKKYKKHVCVCGEMAGNPLFTQELLNLGLRCFSMTPANIQKVKKEILSAKMTDADKKQKKEV